jgi:glycosyltransferase involved in cell wall biosynthesis
MKVCLINNLYRPYSRGGAERIVELAAGEYIRAGDEAVIITASPYFRGSRKPTVRPKGQSRRIQENLVNEKIKRIPGLYYDLAKLPLFLRLPWHLWDMFDFITFRRVKKILEAEKPDLVITHNLKGIGYLIPGLIRRLGVKHIHYLHDIQLIYPSGLLYCGEERKLDGIMARIYQRVCVRLFGSPDKVISPTGWLMELHRNRGFFKNSKYEIRETDCGIRKAGSGKDDEKKISSGVGDNAELRRKNARRGRPFRFLFVGQIEKHKGIGLLVEAFERLNGKAELSIAGDGRLLTELKEKAADNPRIKFLGRKNPEEIIRLMAESDCLAVPSLCYENSPAVICEAALVGLPVIASRIGGIPELAEKYGIELFAPGNADELRELMEKALAC